MTLDLPDTATPEGIKAALAAITQAATSGQIAPSEAQSLGVLIESQRKVMGMDEVLARIEVLEARLAKA